MPQWVQHMSGIGEKWELAIQTGIEDSHIWAVQYPGKMLPVYFPKSEYILCEPPNEWEDVTDEYQAYHHTTFMAVREGDRLIYQDGLINGPHFVIQRNKS